MNFATLMLQEERATIADAAARLGYESEASFSRAYKRTMGSRRVPFASSRAGKYVKFYSAPRSCSP
jgi:transcriptional regulator GlxA family with amidase domain